MPSSPDPLIAFRDEIMQTVIMPKLVSLASENKGTFFSEKDFCDQFREVYNVATTNTTIKKWLKELEISLIPSVQVIINGPSHPNYKESPPPTGVRQSPTDADLDVYFDNE
tara:strand:+ start:50 stop:382 length:333 start_codon:yes stop_codon:yes gene_type:complete